MKKLFFVLFLLIPILPIFSQSNSKKYSSSKTWISSPIQETCGNSIYEIQIISSSKNQQEMQAKLFHTVTPFSQEISQQIILKQKKDKYEFYFTDQWNNKAFGWIKFFEDSATLYLDCKRFGKEGKNYARLYGDTVTLQDTTNNSMFISKALESENKIKKLLNDYNCNFFPVDDNDTLFSIFYVGTVSDIDIYKTELIWNIHSSQRMTHRIVFLENNNILGFYTGIQSKDFNIENGQLKFENFSKDNKIEITNPLPKEVYIDGETYILEN